MKLNVQERYCVRVIRDSDLRGSTFSLFFTTIVKIFVQNEKRRLIIISKIKQETKLNAGEN